MKIAGKFFSFALFEYNADLYGKFTATVQAEPIAIRISVRRTKAFSNIDKFFVTVFIFVPANGTNQLVNIYKCGQNLHTVYI